MRFHVVLDVKSPADTRENTFTTARYNGMLTTSKNLSNQVGAILELCLDVVSRPERAGLSVVLTNEDLMPRLLVYPAL